MTPAERQAARDLRADVLALAAREAGRRHRDPFEVAWGVTSQTEEWLGHLANRARYEGFGEDGASAPGPEAPATEDEAADPEVEAAINEADTYMTEHRVTDSWRVIRRLRDTLVRVSR